MNIYISGISGTGMGPLALMAKGAGLGVYGSDLNAGAITGELLENDIKICLGIQDGSFLKSCIKNEKIDWFVHTSALPKDHPELQIAKKHKLKISKRDELISYLVKKSKLKMVAVAGTHGKTTTTAMIVWIAMKLGIPVSYIIGTTLPFAPAGHYEKNAEYFIYEADEYDRNFLNFHPWLSIIPCITYDHPDIYQSVEEYEAAFQQFIDQSQNTIYGDEIDADLNLAGEVRRYDATLAVDAIEAMMPAPTGLGKKAKLRSQRKKLIKIVNDFPGVGRRFERIAPGFYSDYAHHPEEVAATVEIAKEEADRQGLKGVVVVYEPHQNTRQAELADLYRDAFEDISKIYWTPTYLTRENPKVRVLAPSDYIEKLSNKKVAEKAEFGEELAEELRKWREKGYLILLMSAGPGDAWWRKEFWVDNQATDLQEVFAPRTTEEGSER